MTATLDATLAAVQAEVEQLRTRLSEGVSSESTVLEPLMASFLAKLHAIPKEQAQAYKEKLYELAGSLGELQADFKRQQNGAEEALQLIAHRLKAATAYARSSASAEKPHGNIED
jgi:hypothetical protein